MKPRISRYLLPSLADLTFIGTFLLVLWFGPFISNRDGDMGWHIAIGRYIIQHLTIPRTDLFSYTFYGQPFVPHEWLSEVVFAGAYMLGGFVGVALITAGAVAVTFAGLTAVMQRRGVAPLITLPLVALGVLTSISTWAARPHILTYVFTFVWATAMEEHRLGKLGRRGLLWLLPVMALWVNFHGAFLIGDALIGTYLAGAVWMYLVSAPAARGAYARQIVDLAGLLVLCLLVSGLNPSGFSLIANNFGFFNQGTLLKVTPEWQSPDFHNPLFYPLLLLMGLALVTSVRREITSLLLLISWTFFTLYSFRNSAQLIIITLPLIGAALQSQIEGFVRSPEHMARLSRWARHQIAMPRAINARLRDVQGQMVGGVLSAVVAVFIAILLGTGVKIDMAHFGYGFRPSSFPIEAVQKLKPFPPGKRVFNDSMWGGYLAFAYWPDVLNFIDGRIDFYGTAHKQDYYRVLNGEPGWKDVLDRYQVDWVMVQEDRPLVAWLEQDAGWEKIYSDTTAVVFVRR